MLERYKGDFSKDSFVSFDNRLNLVPIDGAETALATRRRLLLLPPRCRVLGRDGVGETSAHRLPAGLEADQGGTVHVLQLNTLRQSLL